MKLAYPVAELNLLIVIEKGMRPPFIARYNAEWLVEKNGYVSPAALHRQH